MAMTVPERRGSPRVTIDGPMNYRLIATHEFQPGHIENISAGGALVWISEDLPLDSELIVRIDADGSEEESTDLVAILLYKLPEEENSLYGFGCSIELA